MLGIQTEIFSIEEKETVKQFESRINKGLQKIDRENVVISVSITGGDYPTYSVLYKPENFVQLIGNGEV